VLSIAPVVCGVAAVDGVPRQRLPKDQRHAFTGPAVGQPIPREATFDADDPIGPVGRDGLQQRFWASGHVPVEQQRCRLV
jgi:hypothetical protein